MDSLIWFKGFLLGAAFVALTIFGYVAFIVLLLAVLAFVLRGDHLRLSGTITGFGASWTALFVSHLSIGAELAQLAPWLAVGIVMLAIGLALLAAIARRPRSRPAS